MRRILPLVILVCAAWACGSSTAPVRLPLRVSASDSEYTLSGDPAEARIPFHIVNEGDHVLLLAQCVDRLVVEIERYVGGGEWRGYGDHPCPDPADWTSLSLEPGPSLDGARTVQDTGHFELVVDVTDRVTGTQWFARSGSFDVR